MSAINLEEHQELQRGIWTASWLGNSISLMECVGVEKENKALNIAYSQLFKYSQL